MKKSDLYNIYNDSKKETAYKILKDEKNIKNSEKINWLKLLDFEQYILDKKEFDYSVFYKQIARLNDYELVEIWRFLMHIRDIISIDDVEKEMIQRFKDKHIYSKENAWSKEFGSTIFDKNKFIDESVYLEEDEYNPLPEHIQKLIEEYEEQIENENFKECFKLNYKIRVLVQNAVKNFQISYDKYLILQERYKLN